MDRTDLREDLDNQFNWTRIESSYKDINGIETLIQRFSLNDDGTSMTETFGQVTAFGDQYDTITLEDAPDGDGLKVWDSITTFYIDDRNFIGDYGPVFRRIDYDNGMVRYEYFLDTEITTFVTFDNPLPRAGDISDFYYDPTEAHLVLQEFDLNDVVPAGAANWYLNYRYIDPSDGSVITAIQRDDFIDILETRIEGVLAERTQRDISGLNGRAELYDWAVIRELFDDGGVLAERRTFYDDGTERTHTYANGIIQSDVWYDVDAPRITMGGAKPWVSIETLFNAAGETASIQTLYDDGLQRLDTYEDGVRRRIEKTDGPEGSDTDTQNWSSHVQIYDASGGLTENTLNYDDGTVLTDFYTNGARTTRLQIDASTSAMPDTSGVHPWSRVESTFSEVNGALLERSIQNDDGSRTDTVYVDGELRTMVQTDAAITIRPDGPDWQSITTTYEDGEIIHRFTELDSGLYREEQFSNGIRTKRIEAFELGLDIGDAPSIDAFATLSSGAAATRSVEITEFVYDATGDLSRIFVLYDNDDVTGAFYGDGRIVEQQIFDGDGDQSWTGMQLSYGDDGQVSDVFIFATEDDLPDDFEVTDTGLQFTTTGVIEITTPREFDHPMPFSITLANAGPSIPVVDDFNGVPDGSDSQTGGITVTAGGGVTLTGGGTSTVPSVVDTFGQNIQEPPEAFDFF